MGAAGQQACFCRFSYLKERDVFSPLESSMSTKAIRRLEYCTGHCRLEKLWHAVSNDPSDEGLFSLFGTHEKTNDGEQENICVFSRREKRPNRCA